MATRSQIATCNFAGGAGDGSSQIDSVFTNWIHTTTGSVFHLTGDGRAYVRWSNPASAYWNDTFSADQYSQVTIQTLGGDEPGVMVRSSADTGANRDGYIAKMNIVSGSTYTVSIHLVSNGTQGSALATSSSIGWSNGDTLSMEIEGSSIRVYRNYNTSGDTPIVSITDATLTSGRPGLYGYKGPDTARFDDWIGGNLSAAANANIQMIWTL